MNNFTQRYVLMVETDSETLLLQRGFNKGGLLTATEGNQELLETIGDRLLADGTITGYQLLHTAKQPVYPL